MGKCRRKRAATKHWERPSYTAALAKCRQHHPLQLWGRQTSSVGNPSTACLTNFRPCPASKTEEFLATQEADTIRSCTSSHHTFHLDLNNCHSHHLAPHSWQPPAPTASHFPLNRFGHNSQHYADSPRHEQLQKSSSNHHGCLVAVMPMFPRDFFNFKR